MKEPSPKSSNVLLQTPALDTDAEAAIYDVLSRSSLAETNLLVLSYHENPDAWFTNWNSHVGTIPADLGFIDIGGTTRSAAPSDEAATATGFEFVDAVRDPADLTGLGIQISKYLEQWAATDYKTVVYFNSLTALLQFVELDRAYRFLHVMSGRVHDVDGHAFYRLDPDAHETQTAAVIRELMDDVIDLQ